MIPYLATITAQSNDFHRVETCIVLGTDWNDAHDRAYKHWRAQYCEDVNICVDLAWTIGADNIGC